MHSSKSRDFSPSPYNNSLNFDPDSAHGEDIRIPYKALLIILLTSANLAFQLAFLDAGYNTPIRTLEAFITQHQEEPASTDSSSPSYSSNPSVAGKAADLDTYGARHGWQNFGFIILWTSVILMRYLGEIPAIATGRFLADHFGRKGMLFYSCVICMAGLLLQMASLAAKKLFLLFFGRLIHGFGVGWLYLATSYFLMEIIHTDLRFLKDITNVLYVLAVPLIQIMGISNLLGASNLWGFITTPSLALLAINLTMLPCILESPRYLYHIKAPKEDVYRALIFYQGTSTWPQIYIDECMKDEPFGHNVHRGFRAIPDAWQRSSAQRTAISVVIVASILGRLAYSCILTQYSTYIFSEYFGISNLDLAQPLTVAVFVAATLLPALLSRLTLESWNRRLLILLSTGMVIFGNVWLFALPFAMYTVDLSDFIGRTALKYFSVAAIGLILSAYYLGLEKIPSYLAKENMSALSRRPTLALGRIAGLFAEAVVVALFLPMNLVLGIGWGWLPLLALLVMGFTWIAVACPYYENRSRLHATHKRIPLMMCEDEGGGIRSRRARFKKGAAKLIKRAQSSSPVRQAARSPEPRNRRGRSPQRGLGAPMTRKERQRLEDERAQREANLLRPLKSRSYLNLPTRVRDSSESSAAGHQRSGSSPNRRSTFSGKIPTPSLPPPIARAQKLHKAKKFLT